MAEFVEIQLPPEAHRWSPEMFRQFFSHAWAMERLATQAGLPLEGDFSAVLDLSCEPTNQLAVLESVDVLDVALVDDEIRVLYAVSLSQFHPCQDRHDHWRFERTLIGNLRGCALRFPVLESHPDRSTCDEL